MNEPETQTWTAIALLIFGTIAGGIFYTRFYVQWLYSEYKGESKVPVAFWYQSAIGSVLLLIYAGLTRSPLGALSQCINIFPYVRNLMFIWKEKGRITKRTRWTVYVLAGLGIIAGLTTVVWLWVLEYQVNSASTAEEARQTWFWLGVGVLGQALFGTRFLIQWIATEMKRKSVVPTIFWYISLVASLLQAASFFQRGQEEWVYSIGLIANMLIYVRNIWLIHTRGPQDAAQETPAS